MNLEYFSGKKILLTGPNGYIGSGIIKALSPVACHILRVSRSTAQPPLQLERARVTDLQVDYSDASVWADVMGGVDVVFYLGAQTSTYVANQNPQADYMTNVLPIVNLLSTCARLSLKPTIVFASSATVVGLPQTLPVGTDGREDPVSIYDAHKLIVEKYLRYYFLAHGQPTCALRLANVYGPGVSSSAPDRGILNLMMRKGLAGQALTIYGSGEYYRDYVYIDDVIEAFLAAAVYIKTTAGEHLNVGSGEKHTVREAISMVAQEVCSLTGRNAVLTHVEAPKDLSPIEYRNYVADCSKTEKLMGWRAKLTLTNGIRQTIQYMLKN